MIKLEVEDYCQDCEVFEADVDHPTVYFAEGRQFVVGDTVVRCEHREICKHVVEWMKKKGKEAN